ncbi:hypothetical protein ACP4OV_012181 [Aristida adscensionis]
MTVDKESDKESDSDRIRTMFMSVLAVSQQISARTEDPRGCSHLVSKALTNRLASLHNGNSTNRATAIAVMATERSPLSRGSMLPSAAHHPASPESILVSASYISQVVAPDVNAVPISMSPHLGADPLRHVSMMSPPAHVSPGQIATPDATKTYVHGDKVNPQLVPTLEMKFKDEEEAWGFYLAYAEHAGFGIKKNRKRNRGQEYSCTFEGRHKAKTKKEREREKTSMRRGCKALVQVQMSKDGEYAFFKRIVLEHNHPLNASKKRTRHMRSHKEKDPSLWEYVDELHAAKVPPNATMTLLKEAVGGTDNLNITEQDLHNRKAASVREGHNDDITKLFKFFKQCKVQKPQFYHDFQVDDKHVVRNVFWSHASQQGDYADFGDCVTFDTTYRTNMYSMPLAMFVGCNHQLQNVIFAQALIRDERADTFEWVFECLLECMGGKMPICILTDQDSAMEKAIKEVFPKSQHRYCRFHVLRKYKDPIAILCDQKQGLHDEMTTVINFPLTPTEFEAAWGRMVEKHGLHDKVCMLNLYDDRRKWITAYYKGIFCATMQSTQRSESVNATVKSGYVDNSTAIHEFAKRFLDLLEHTKHKESQEAHNSQAPNITATQYAFEKQASRVYSRAVYQEFRDQYYSSTGFLIRDDPQKPGYYLVHHRKNKSTFPWLQHEYRVKARYNEENPEESVFECECMTWENTGMFCAHLILAFTRLQVSRIPSKYILKRYIRNPTTVTQFSREDRPTVGPDGVLFSHRHRLVLHEALAFVRSACKSEEACQKAISILRDARVVIDAMPSDSYPQEAIAQEERNMQGEQQVSSSAPSVSSTKGRNKRGAPHPDAPEPHRARETDAKRRRRCSECLQKAGHNAATCKRLKAEAAAAKAAGEAVRGGRGRGGTKLRGRPPGRGGRGRGRIVSTDREKEHWAQYEHEENLESNNDLEDYSTSDTEYM